MNHSTVKSSRIEYFRQPPAYILKFNFIEGSDYIEIPAQLLPIRMSVNNSLVNRKPETGRTGYYNQSWQGKITGITPV
jgi:hypothetical protein